MKFVWIALGLIAVGLLGSMAGHDPIAAFLAPDPKTLLVAVELGTGARRSVASYPSESECLRIERNLNLIAEENGRTERVTCVEPVDVARASAPIEPASGSQALH